VYNRLRVVTAIESSSVDLGFGELERTLLGLDIVTDGIQPVGTRSTRTRNIGVARECTGFTAPPRQRKKLSRHFC